MPRYLTDENISPIVAQEVGRLLTGCDILSILEWHNSRYVSKDDELILGQSEIEGLTLITYDRHSIRRILNRWYELERNHSGVVYINNATIRNNDFRSIIRALLVFCEACADRDLTNTEHFLQPK